MYGFKDVNQMNGASVEHIRKRSGLIFQRPGLLMRFMSVLSVALFIFLIGGISTCNAYTVIEATPLLEQALIAQTTSQFDAKLVKNPLVPNTYQITLYSHNKNYNPPVTNADLLKAVVTVDSFTYVYGFVAGMEYQNRVDVDRAGYFEINCSSVPLFNLMNTSTSTFNIDTCKDVTATILNDYYTFRLSTPTYIGGGF